MTSAVETHFRPNYVTAREHFRTLAVHAGGRLESLKLDSRGPHGEDLTIDTAWFGADQPRRVLLHCSGLHGVEAFAGSAIQLQWLAQGIPEVPQDSAIVLVHVLNPYGMAWLRRYNENNVDLNRNFLGSGEAYEGAAELYRELDHFLNPQSPPTRDLFSIRAGWLAFRFGTSRLKQAIAYGQYVSPRGLFFGGSRLEQGPRLWQDWVIEHLGNAERLAVIDVHTGLGPFGEDRLLVESAKEGSPLYDEIGRSFGERVEPLRAESSVAYQFRGAHYSMYSRALPRAVVHFVAQEFGTHSATRVLYALRQENRCHHYGEGSVDHPVKLALKETFAPTELSWRAAVLTRGEAVIRQALALAFGETSGQADVR